MPAKVLVVDDELPLERLIQQQFRKRIREQELEFVFAHNGVEALEKVKADPQIDMVMTDINMPEMDGLTLLSKLQEFDPEIKTVVVSAYSDMSNIRTAMNQNAFDFLTKPIDFKDLEVTLNRTIEYVQNRKATKYQLQKANTQLIQSEKMSALGQLVAGVAHEIYNPVNFVTGNISHAQGYIQDILNLLNLYQQHYPNPVADIQDEIEAIELDYLLEDLPKLVSSMKLGIDRIRQITIALKVFSRSDTSSKMSFNIHEGIDSTLLILRHRWKGNGDHPAIEVIKEYGDFPEIMCFPGQLNQVFMNILANAIDALEEVMHSGKTEREPKIKIRTEMLVKEANATASRASAIAIHITDNGVGMPEEVQQKLFQSIFTTKPTGKGTGLGLSISHQIVVDKHGGELRCVSIPGEGTEFIIELPIQ